MAPKLGPLVPQAVYAEGDMQSGRKWIVMQDLGEFVDSGEGGESPRTHALSQHLPCKARCLGPATRTTGRAI